jgi:hypothetical protein
MRTLAAAAAAALSIAAVGAVVLAGEANAQSAPSTGTISRPTNAYTAPHSGSPAIIFGLQPGQRTTVLCFIPGETVNGIDYWFRIGQGGESGFVHRDYLVPDGPVDRC